MESSTTARMHEGRSLYRLLPNTQRVLLFVEGMAMADGFAVMELLSRHPVGLSLIVSGEERAKRQPGDLRPWQDSIVTLRAFTHEYLYSILSDQKIGTHIYAAGSWAMIEELKITAAEVGFADSTIQVQGYGARMESVFCVKCYNLCRKRNNDRLRCEHCHTLLEVTDQYSVRLRAYLGNIAASQ